LLDKTNTAASVWADTAYRSVANEAYMAKNGFVSRIHRKKPKGRPMPDAIRRANALKSKVRSRIEHVFAEQKDRMGLFIRTIGIARAKVKIGMANLVYNFKRLVFWEGPPRPDARPRRSSALAAPDGADPKPLRLRSHEVVGLEPC
jgi:IS5 family transposase